MRVLAGALAAVVAVCTVVGLMNRPKAKADEEWKTFENVDPGIDDSRRMTSVIVTMWPFVNRDTAKDFVASSGGRVLRDLWIIPGFVAEIPGNKTEGLGDQRGVVSVTANRPVHFLDDTLDPVTSAVDLAVSPLTDTLHAQGSALDGSGVGIALIDTGVADVPDLAGRVVHGANLSGDPSGTDEHGHGTPMASVIAGDGAASGGEYRGVAPRATVVSVKVAGRDGSTSLDRLLDGLAWVQMNKANYNIRALNLSWGMLSTQAPALDPLNLAVERLWYDGVVVVTAAGNSGPTANTINLPGDNPTVLTVGAANDSQTTDFGDDGVAEFSSRGPTNTGGQKPDLVAPGQYVVSAKSPGSLIDVENPQAWVGDAYLRGSGTSQATAAMSGLVALLLQARPDLSPGQVKELLRGTARSLGADVMAQGSGVGDLAAALVAATPPATEDPSGWRFRNEPLTKLLCNNVVVRFLKGTNTCLAILSKFWRGDHWVGAKWLGGFWKRLNWASDIWMGKRWKGGEWDAKRWKGDDWTGKRWKNADWD